METIWFTRFCLLEVWVRTSVVSTFLFSRLLTSAQTSTLVMTVIYIIQACQVGNVSIVVIQIKPGRREYIDSSGIGKDRGNRVICRLVCDLMPGHTDIVIFLYMCKGIRSEIAFSCFSLTEESIRFCMYPIIPSSVITLSQLSPCSITVTSSLEETSFRIGLLMPYLTRRKHFFWQWQSGIFPIDW